MPQKASAWQASGSRGRKRSSNLISAKILADLGIQGEYEGIGHCALGYAAEPAKEADARKRELCVLYEIIYKNPEPDG